jgi:heat shock protein HtpX
MVAMATVPTVALGVVVTVVLLVLLGWVGLLIGIVATGAAAAWAWTRASVDPTDRVLRDLRARPADPSADARLWNLVDGLALTGGITAPQLHVVDTEGANLLVIGLDERQAHLVTTTGLLEGLERIELEAVLARAVVQIRRGDLGCATTAVEVLGDGQRGAPLLTRPVAGVLASRLGSRGRPGDDVVLDRDAVGLTRYPPGLIAALRKLQDGATTVPGASVATGALWLADPFPPTRPGSAAHTPIADRIEALELL